MKLTIASLFALASLTAVSAQGVGPGGIDICILECSQSAATEAGCTGVLDLNCICTSADFQNAATACLIANCTEQQQQTAVQLQQQQCQGQSVSGSLSTTISAPSASGSAIDGGVISSLSNSLGSITAPIGGSATSNIPSASGTGGIISGISASASSAISAGGSAVSGASSSVSSVISGATSSPNAAGNKAEFGIKWGVVGASVMGVMMGALAVF